MLEHQERPSVTFTRPNLRREMGEIERVATQFAPGHEREFMKRFVETAEGSSLVNLTEEIWSKLENTDSYDISTGNWDLVKHNAEQIGREWESKKATFENAGSISAPIILKFGEKYHKVAGNI
jgi:hypothetical protein